MLPQSLPRTAQNLAMPCWWSWRIVKPVTATHLCQQGRVLRGSRLTDRFSTRRNGSSSWRTLPARPNSINVRTLNVNINSYNLDQSGSVSSLARTDTFCGQAGVVWPDLTRLTPQQVSNIFLSIQETEDQDIKLRDLNISFTVFGWGTMDCEDEVISAVMLVNIPNWKILCLVTE